VRAALAVDLGGTELRVALVGENGGFLARDAEPTLARDGPDAVIGQIVRLLGRMESRAEGCAIVGVGVGAPGPLDPGRGVVLRAPTLDGWSDVPLVALLSARLGRPVRLENDANAAALGEWLFGAGRGTRHMVFVTVSTGIGGGVIVDGRLLHGRHGMAAEIGHMAVSEREIACPCGSTGCWEALAAGPALARFARAAARQGEATSLPRDGGISARDVFAAAAAGDTLARGLIEQEARWLGVGFANLLHLYSPERIIVGGGVSAGLAVMRPTIEQVMRRRAMAAYRDVPLLQAALGADAGLAGAAGAIDDAVFLHLADAERDDVVGLVGVVLLDELVRRLVVAVQVVVPALDRGLDERLHHCRLGVDEFLRHHHHRRIARIAVVGEQIHLRRDALLADHVRLGRQVALLDRRLVDQPRRHVEGVFADLGVLEPVFGVQPDPERADRAVGDHDRLALHVGKRLDVVARVRHQDLRVLLERRHHRAHRRARLHKIEWEKAVAAHRHVDRAGRDQLLVVDAGPTLMDHHLEAALLVQAGGERLIEAAVLGLGLPVGREHDLLVGRRRPRREQRRDRAGNRR
jgi:glucokinase